MNEPNSMQRRSVFAVLLLGLAVFILTYDVVQAQQPPGPAAIVIVQVSPTASSAEKVAADELVSHLSRLYPQVRFGSGVQPAGAATFTIRLGTPASAPDLAQQVGRQRVTHAESYVVTNDRAGTGIILGADPRGVMYGVYGLLEKLGCGFYLTCDTYPDQLPGAFSLDAWELADRPLVPYRFVFNWHNFLSGCTGWNEADWESWITQSQKMGFNTVMVHAYGNNPMFTYSFRGLTKEVGYYGTSRKGRDWGRQHINDVRRIPGGEIFTEPEFGADAALVPDEQRTAAAQALMQHVFQHAERRGMDVCFALDVDTPSVLLQDMINALPESARFSNGRTWLPKPGTPDGAAFYRAQVEALLKLYPEIDVLALWRRNHGAEWGVLKTPDQLPEEWQPGYRAVVQQHPGAEALPQAVCSYALGKVVAAFRTALDQLGRQDVRIAMGSWDTDYVPALAVFLPPEVTIMPLDSSCMERYRRGSFLDVPEAFADLEQAKGRIQPIIWAHHDDGEYIGRPMKSHTDFCDALQRLDARGYGIIHWMKRPLDLHFRNHEKQVWASTRNQTLRETCQIAARHWFGQANAGRMAQYLEQWWTKAPIFGRVTTDKFFNGQEHIPDPDAVIAACHLRQALLAGADSSTMPPEGRSRLEYFQQLEQLIISFCQVQELAYRPALAAIAAGDFDAAQWLLKSADPAQTIRGWSRLAQLDGGDRGEVAMVLSLGTRWLTDYIAARQKVGLEPVRINFAATRHEPLAQGAGRYTFFIDSHDAYWSVQGAEETKGTIVAVPQHDADSARAAGWLLDTPVSVTLSTIVPSSGPFRPGDYQATLLLEGDGQGVASLSADARGTSEVVSFDPVKAHYLRLVCHGNSENQWNSIIRVRLATLAAGDAAQVVTSSGAVDGYPATAVLDEDPNSRWAFEGPAWIQLRLDPNRETRSLMIDWFQAARRRARFSVEVSDDGQQWREVRHWVQGQGPESVTSFAVHGASQEVTISGHLDQPGQLRLSLQPRQGQPVLAGVVLQRVED